MTSDVLSLSYRQYAADCLRQAHDETTQDGRTIMLNVALAWLRLAEQKETIHAEAAEPTG